MKDLFADIKIQEWRYFFSCFSDIVPLTLSFHCFIFFNSFLFVGIDLCCNGQGSYKSLAVVLTHCSILTGGMSHIRLQSLHSCPCAHEIYIPLVAVFLHVLAKNYTAWSCHSHVFLAAVLMRDSILCGAYTHLILVWPEATSSARNWRQLRWRDQTAKLPILCSVHMGHWGFERMFTYV